MISIQWPYSANLHCEILVDDQLFAQADQFIGPKLTPARDDPDYGAMHCGAPLSNAPGYRPTSCHYRPGFRRRDSGSVAGSSGDSPGRVPIDRPVRRDQLT